MKKALLLLICIIGISINIKAQKEMLVFYNDSARQAIGVKKYGTVMLEYKGYLNQTELKTNTIIEISDSTVVLAKPRIFNGPTQHHSIMLNDITGFRKVSAGSQLLKTAIILGVTVGSYFAISNNDNFSNTEQVVYATAIGLGTTYGLKLIFPMNRPKYFFKDGWKVRTR
ncbi:hypothetical protein [Saccharicrinis aurantiacus]|uniref:hypothetical protein n=1 Tax=Saccharicrinis aurantiacus TaxID=1849719 RepID=UPI00249366CC|nr:hypothetical protein [Saccharicrinis aurantiacus]